MSSHAAVREPHPPGTPRERTERGGWRTERGPREDRERERPGRFYTPRERGQGGREDDLVLPDIDTPTAVLYAEGEREGGIDALVSVRQVKLKSGVNLGRGVKARNRVVHTKVEKKRTELVGTMSAQQKQDRVDEKEERRKRLLAKLPVIENDPAAQKHMISKINRQLVEAHNELDRLKLQRVKKRERLRELRDKYADTCRDSGVAVGKKSKGTSTALVVSKGSIDPRMLRMQAELSKLRRRMEGLTEERLSMECMRERMESEWILSVARLREKRNILAQHDGNDEALTKDYLSQCMQENSHAQGDLRAEKRLLLEDSKRREHALEGLRMSVALELNTIKMDAQYEERRKLVIAAQAGDLDSNGEARLKARAITGQFRALMVNKQSQRSLEEMRRVIERIDKIKEVTGSRDTAHLLVRYEELKANNKVMSAQKDEAHLRISELERDREKCQLELEHIGEFGAPGVETSKTVINGYEQQQRHADERYRRTQRLCYQSEKMVTASRLTVQSVLMALKRIRSSEAFQIDIIQATHEQSSLVQWLEKCARHLQEMDESLPSEFSTLRNERTTQIDVSDPADWKLADPDGSLHLGGRVWFSNILLKLSDREAAARVRGVTQVLLDGKEYTQFTKDTLNRMNVNELRMAASESKVALSLVHAARAAGPGEKAALIAAIYRRCSPAEPRLATRVAREEREGYHPAASLREEGDYYYEEGVGDASPGVMYFLSDENPGHTFRHGIEVKLVTAADLAEQSRAVVLFSPPSVLSPSRPSVSLPSASLSHSLDMCVCACVCRLRATTFGSMSTLISTDPGSHPASRRRRTQRRRVRRASSIM